MAAAAAVLLGAAADPQALAVIMGRGEGAIDKAAIAYAPINRMCDPHGNANLLTSAANDSWKAVRKAVAVSFSIQHIKKKFPLVLGRVNQLVARIAAQGPGASIDVDQAALRVTLDVIGLVSSSEQHCSSIAYHGWMNCCWLCCVAWAVGDAVLRAMFAA
jgi:cytochrome P450